VAPFINVPVVSPNPKSGQQTFFTWRWKDDGVRDNPWRLAIDWGDGTRNSGVLNSQADIATSHAFRAKGTYTVGITITDRDGAPTLKSTTVVVR
jgi:hypothetical protein